MTAGTGESSLTAVNVSPTDGVSTATDAISIKAILKASEIATANSSITIKSNLKVTEVALPTASIALSGNLQSSQTSYSPAAHNNVTYDATITGQSMASGGVAPHFIDKVEVIDNVGTTHILAFNYLKTAADTWAVEVATQPAADVTQADGQIAYGTLTFNSDGTLASVSSGLSSSVTAGWAVGGSTTLSLNFGTVAAANGIGQVDSGFDEFAITTPDYSPTSSTKSMASGLITPHFSRAISVLDGAGASHTLTASFLKTAADTWAVELYAPVAADVVSATGVDGQVAYGTLTFNSTGTLASASPALLKPVSIDWESTTEPTTTKFDFGTLGTFTGITQMPVSVSLPTPAYTTTATTPTEAYSPIITAKNMASGAVQANYGRDIDVVQLVDQVDSSGVTTQVGVTRTLTVGFLKTADNTWAVEVYAKTPSQVTTTDGQIAHGNMVFNGDGTLNSVDAGLSSAIDVLWAAGDPSAITIDWGTAGAIFGTPGATVIGKADGMSQVDSEYTTDQVIVNGAVAGKLSNVSVDADGYVTAVYDNSSIHKLYKIPLAVFHDPNLLTELSGNLFEQNGEVGTPIYAQAGKGGAGKIQGSALELSTVEVASQLTDMVIAQRAYQSNTKVISTTDEMLKTITQMLG
ncbi:MAG: flagellar hook-basal body complex protein [Alphaproteobacteria bacterium]|nr:flagellar hook-basal body complex protein [Alphaproteobacteria bacterium]